jgi:hypothetical protein
LGLVPNGGRPPDAAESPAIPGQGFKAMSLIQFFVAILLVGVFCLIPAGIYLFARCFTGRGWTFLDYNRDANP